MARKLFVFDLDDTLMDNMHDYAEPILDATRLIIQTLGNKAPHVSQIIAMEQEIDKRRVKEINPSTDTPFLYSMERFPGSLVEVYQTLCEKAGVPIEAKIETKLLDIGLQAFDLNRHKKNINPHAKEIMNFIKESADRVYICTKGDQLVQNHKLAALEQAGVWNSYSMPALITSDKSARTFDRIKRMFPLLMPYSVGNSYASDIKPALEAGYLGVFIPVETWDVIGQMDIILKEVDRKRCVVLKDLSELKSRYKELPS